MTDREVLNDAGKVSHELAKEFEKYRIIQDKLFESDFDKLLAPENVEELAKRVEKKVKTKPPKRKK